MSEPLNKGKLLYLNDLRIDENGDLSLVKGHQHILRRLLNMIDPSPPKVLEFPAQEPSE